MRRPPGFASAFRDRAISIALTVVLGGAFDTAAAAFTPHPAPGRLLLQLRDGVAVRSAAQPGKASPTTGQPRLDALGARFGVTAFSPQFPAETTASKAIAGTDLSRFFVLEFPETVDLETIRAAYALDPAVRVAEFDMMEPLLVDANDAANQWYLESSLGKDAHAPGGWNHSQGDSTVLLAIADTGVDWQHPDLGGSGPSFINGNVWINWQEYNGTPGVDDDANGYIDDVRGWDFVSTLSGAWPGEDSFAEDNDPRDFNGHGTHVAGIADAITNNGVGVAGMGWKCKLMALRIGGSINNSGTEQGVVLMSSAASALNYARQKGAAAFNCSWGSSNSAGLAAAVSAAVAQGMVVCVAAGNENSAVPSYLGSRGDCFDIAATGNDDLRASFSNFGSWIDVCAPGVGIYSTYFNHSAVPSGQHTYDTLQGTSMATPVVVGLVGLVKAATPGMSGTQIKNAIKAGCDNIDSLNPGFAGLLGAGRVNALRAFKDYHLTVPQEYATFDKALAASGAGDTLALRGGDIYTTGWYLWRSNRLVQGGWDASYTTRDPINNPTIVQRNGTGPAVEIVIGVDASLVVDGVSFSGGVARALSSPLQGIFGGGVLCIGASPTFRNCRFVSNAAGDGFNFGGGGGGFFSGSASQLVNCAFTTNAAQAGAGLYVHNSTLTIQGGSITGNSIIDGSATTTGGGICLDGGTLTLDGVTIANNTGADEGGGLYVKAGTLDGHALVIQGNGATMTGGNVRVASGAVLLLRASEVRGGTAPFGGGISALNAATLTVTSSVIADNVGSFLGGGVYATAASGDFENVSWNANRGTAGGGDAVYASACPTAWVVHNCIASNHPVSVNPALTFSGTAPVLDYNLFWNNAGGNLGGGSLGAHDATANPLFVDAVNGDLALGLHSPALDAGDPAPAYTDHDASRNDQGAYGGPIALSRAPAPPAGMSVVRLGGPPRNVLSWSANPELDISFYAVYRGTTASFVPSAATYLGSSTANVPAFSDNGGTATSWYRIAAVDLSGASSGFSPAKQPSPTDTPPPAAKRFVLHQNEPNPFNPTTVLRYEIPAPSRVHLAIYDSAGRLVRRLADGVLPAGDHAAVWDGRDESGRSLASGVYVARLEAGAASGVRKMILVR